MQHIGIQTQTDRQQRDIDISRAHRQKKRNTRTHAHILHIIFIWLSNTNPLVYCDKKYDKN